MFSASTWQRATGITPILTIKFVSYLNIYICKSFSVFHVGDFYRRDTYFSEVHQEVVMYSYKEKFMRNMRMFIAANVSLLSGNIPVHSTVSPYRKNNQKLWFWIKSKQDIALRFPVYVDLVVIACGFKL